MINWLHVALTLADFDYFSLTCEAPADTVPGRRLASIVTASNFWSAKDTRERYRGPDKVNAKTRCISYPEVSSDD